ncbi:MAG: hypothetical protein ACU0CO_13340 [Shimia sp.]
MSTRRAFLAGGSALGLTGLAGCATNGTFADDAVVNQFRYVHDGPTEVQLYTSFNVGTDNGAHSALLINASERVVFDPAGSFAFEQTPERNDVLHGMTPRLWRAFVSYHVRETFWGATQRVRVDPQMAERILREAKAAGPVMESFCTRSICGVLTRAGFPGVRPTFWPNNLHDQFQRIPGVERREFHETDSADKEDFWRTFDG